ncbi:MAG TPA: ferredoxin [Clostridiales bacterium]|nr:ferredoxin [Clostridiales bacterium]
MNYNINAMYFSPTGTTERAVKKIAAELSLNFESKDINYIDFTPLSVRSRMVRFNADDIVIFGVPVYAGRVPNVLLNYINSVKSSGALAVAVVLYGNRNYDDALIELRDILDSNGFKVIAACAFVGEHSFSEMLAKDRPDETDLNMAGSFAKQIFNKITGLSEFSSVSVEGNRPYRSYYKPKDGKGNPVDIRKVTPRTNSNCTDCKLCAKVCPMGSIDYKNVSLLTGICIKCGACIKKCPVSAKYYDDENYLRHKHELEDELTIRKNPELFL